MSNDLQYVAHADTDTRAMRQMVESHGASIEIAGEAIQEGLEAVASSNREIAKAIKEAGKLTASAILEAGQLVESGLARIADEIRRKTYMDEYYLLLDRIDSLEDKIVAKSGKKIQEIYDILENKYVPTIALSNSEILTMHSCLDKETMRWFKMVASTYKVNPWSVFRNVLEACGEGLVYHIPFGATYHIAYYSSHRMPIYYDGQYTEANAKKISEFSDDEISWHEMNFYISVAVNEVRDVFDELKCLSNEQLNLVNEFNAFINGINVEIMMENIRLLHTELRKVYRQMK